MRCETCLKARKRIYIYIYTENNHLRANRRCRDAASRPIPAAAPLKQNFSRSFSSPPPSGPGVPTATAPRPPPPSLPQAAAAATAAAFPPTLCCRAASLRRLPPPWEPGTISPPPALCAGCLWNAARWARPRRQDTASPALAIRTSL